MMLDHYPKKANSANTPIPALRQANATATFESIAKELFGIGNELFTLPHTS